MSSQKELLWHPLLIALKADWTRLGMGTPISLTPGVIFLVRGQDISKCLNRGWRAWLDMNYVRNTWWGVHQYLGFKETAIQGCSTYPSHYYMWSSHFYPSGCVSLNFFYFTNIFFCIRAPDCWGILKLWATRVLYAIVLISSFLVKIFLITNPTVLLAQVVILLIWVFLLRSLLMLTPRYFSASTDSNFWLRYSAVYNPHFFSPKYQGQIMGAVSTADKTFGPFFEWDFSSKKKQHFPDVFSGHWIIRCKQ